MNVIDLRTTDERMAPLDFDMNPAELAEAKVYQAQLDRQRRDRNDLDRCTAEKRQRANREQWQANVADLSRIRVVNGRVHHL